MRRGILVAGMMALLAIPAAAQQGGGQGQGPGRMGPPQSGRGIFQDISLTADQQKKVDSIWTAYAPVRDEMRAKMQPGQMPDSATRVQMMGMRKAHQGDMRTVLTPEQQKVFDKNAAEMEKRGLGMGGGMGGGMGPGPGPGAGGPPK